MEEIKYKSKLHNLVYDFFDEERSSGGNISWDDLRLKLIPRLEKMVKEQEPTTEIRLAAFESAMAIMKIGLLNDKGDDEKDIIKKIENLTNGFEKVIKGEKE